MALEQIQVGSVLRPQRSQRRYRVARLSTSNPEIMFHPDAVQVVLQAERGSRLVVRSLAALIDGWEPAEASA